MTCIYMNQEFNQNKPFGESFGMLPKVNSVDAQMLNTPCPQTSDQSQQLRGSSFEAATTSTASSQFTLPLSRIFTYLHCCSWKDVLVTDKFCFAPIFLLSIPALTKTDICHVNVGQTCKTVRAIPTRKCPPITLLQKCHIRSKSSN